MSFGRNRWFNFIIQNHMCEFVRSPNSGTSRKIFNVLIIFHELNVNCYEFKLFCEEKINLQ